MSGASPCGVMPSTVAIAAGTDAGSPTDASSTIHTPSGNSPATSAPTSSASRVLPTPPTPVSVTSRFDRTSSATSATSVLAADERAQLLRAGCRRSSRRCAARGTPSAARRRRPGTPTSVRAARGAGARPAAAASRGRAAAPRSRRRRAPDRRARATSAVPRGSPRCRSSSGRVRSPRRCAAPIRTAKSTAASSRSCSCDSIAAAAASAAVENAAQKPSPPVREHVAAVALDRAAHDGVVDPQRVGHVGRGLLPQTRRSPRCR